MYFWKFSYMMSIYLTARIVDYFFSINDFIWWKQTVVYVIIALIISQLFAWFGKPIDEIWAKKKK